MVRGADFTGCRQGLAPDKESALSVQVFLRSTVFPSLLTDPAMFIC